MRDCAGVPKLCNDATAGRMDGIRDAPPSADLVLRPEAWCIGPAKSFRANRGGFGDDQTSRSTLRVILRLQGRGNVITRLGTHPGERRHDDAVRKIEVSHWIWCEKRLIRHHLNSCIDRQNVLKRSLRLHRLVRDKTPSILRCWQLPHTVLRMSKRHYLNSLRR